MEVSPEGARYGGAARADGSPLQGLGALPTPTQGDALGWYRAAPLGLNTFITQVLGYCLPPSGLGMGSDDLGDTVVRRDADFTIECQKLGLTTH